MCFKDSKGLKQGYPLPHLCTDATALWLEDV